MCYVFVTYRLVDKYNRYQTCLGILRVLIDVWKVEDCVIKNNALHYK